MTPPQTQFSREDVLKAAFETAQQEGLKDLSARKIANCLGCSTAPVYSSFDSMADLEKEVVIMARDLLVDYTKRGYTDQIFLNMGMGFAIFSREQKHLFRTLFLENDRYKEIIAEFGENMREQMDRDPQYAQLGKKQRLRLLHKMWIFTHGLASLICVGLVHDDSDKYIQKLLLDVGSEIIAATFLKASGNDNQTNEKAII